MLDGAATGLPLVATDIPGSRTVVRHGMNGFLIPPRDGLALAAALEGLLQDSSLRARFGIASRGLAVEEFNEERIVLEYLALYERIGALGVRAS